MGLFDGPPQKSSAAATAERARRERAERDQRRRAAADSARLAVAAAIVLRWWRSRRAARTGAAALLRDWDRRCGFAGDAGASPVATEAGSVPERSPAVLLQCVWILVRIYDPAVPGHVDRLAHLCKVITAASKSRSIFASLLSDPRRKAACTTVLSLPYTSGPELLFLVTLWDAKRWAGAAATFAADVRHPAYGTVLQVLSPALLARIKLAVTLRDKGSRLDPVDERALKSLTLWIGAAINLVTLPALQVDGDANGICFNFNDAVTFHSQIMSVPLLCSFSVATETIIKSCILEATSALRNDDGALVSSAMLDGERCLFFIGNLVDLQQKLVDSGSKAQLVVGYLPTFNHSKNSILNAICWTPSLVTQLWRLLTAVPPSGLANFTAAKDPSALPTLPMLVLFCDAARMLLITLDEDDIFQRRTPLSPDLLSHVSRFLNDLCFRALWSPAAAPTVADTEPIASALRLLALLHDRWVRTPFTGPPPQLASAKPDVLRAIGRSLRPRSGSRFGASDDDAKGFWVVTEVAGPAFVDRVRDAQPPALRVLKEMPHAVPFARRVDIFRMLVGLERSRVADVAVIATIRRTRWRQTIRIKFINEMGLDEIGVDQNGVFKEFLEDICKQAFAPNFGLFRTTDEGSCVPSLSSSVHEDHLQLLEFVGKVFGKALYEGIVIDIPFATFVYAKLLGRMNFLEDLPSLDPQLYKNLIFLKHYEGDAEDLGLTFTVDQEVFGSVKSQ
ncbi:hypothetical protein HK405_009413, partial [Cladochytrium tenue]